MLEMPIWLLLNLDFILIVISALGAVVLGLLFLSSQRTDVLLLLSQEVIIMQEHTVDLMTIPFYQQMAQVFYVDRGMMKWAGMLLSEHNEQMRDEDGAR